MEFKGGEGELQGRSHTAFSRQAKLLRYIDVAFVVAFAGGLQSLDIDVVVIVFVVPWGTTVTALLVVWRHDICSVRTYQ